MLADCHAHLDYPDYADSLDEVIDSSTAQNIAIIVTTGTDIKSSLCNLAITEKYDSVYAAIGIHPHEVEKIKIEELNKLIDIAKHKKVVAIGETGLDFYYDNAPRDLQERFFRKQIEIALESDKPIVVHSRNADEFAFKILLENGVRKAYFHCYTGAAELGLRISAAGYMIGVTGIVTFNNQSNAELIKQLPLTSLLTETDCPFLSPKPFRGKRNEPARISVILDRIKTLFPNLSGDEVQRTLWENANRFFQLAAFR
jgi:TatD DNase family protein